MNLTDNEVISGISYGVLFLKQKPTRPFFLRSAFWKGTHLILIKTILRILNIKSGVEWLYC